MKKRPKAKPVPPSEMRSHDSGQYEVTMQEAESVRLACMKWLKKRNLLHEHESFKFGNHNGT